MDNESHIANKIRKFNRFYTNVLGLLDKNFLDSQFSLTEVRVMFEIYYTKNCTAKDIRCRIDIDEGYLSRIIDRFVKLNFVKKRRSSKDSRIKFILLTEKGRSEFLRLDKHSQDAVTEMISNLSDMERNVLIKMMGNIEIILSKV